MVTRSQAAKREADEEVSRPPAKSPRSSLSDDSTTRRRNALQRSDSTPDGTASNDPADKGKSTVEKPTRPTDVSKTGNATAQLDTILEQQESSSSEDTATPAVKNPAPRPGTAKATESAAKQAPRVEARNLIMQLQVVLERQCVDRGNVILPVEADKQRKSMLQLCERATTEGVTENVFLKFFAADWFKQMQSLHKAMVKSAEVRARIDDATIELTVCIEAYVEAVRKRSDVLVGLGDRSEQNKDLLNEAIVEAYGKMRGARTELGRLYDLRKVCDTEDRQLSKARLATAEKVLVEKGYLTPRRAVGPKEAEQTAPATRPSSGRSKRSSQRSPQRRRRSSSERRESGEHPASDAQGRREESNGSDRRNDGKHNILHELRDNACQNLEEARALYNDSMHRFEDVRARYHSDLLRFTQQKERGEVVGTRTEFDLTYYLSRSHANHNFALAHDGLDYAVAQADKSGALSIGERIRIFDDEAESESEGSGEGAVGRMLHEFAMENVETWRQDKGHEDVRGKSDWESMLSPPGSDEEVELDGFSALERRQGLADNFEGKRKAIDDWIIEQERTRRRNKDQFPAQVIE